MDEPLPQGVQPESRDQRPIFTFPSEGEATAISSNKMEEYSKYLVGALKAIEDRLPIAGALVIVIGYVVIAAFGKVDSFWKYIAYISILLFAYLFYKIKTAKLSRMNSFLLSIIIALLLYIAIDQGFLSSTASLIK